MGSAYLYVVPPAPLTPSISDTRSRSMVTKSSYYFQTYWWNTKNGYPWANNAPSGTPNITWTSSYATGQEVKIREAANAAITMAVCANWGGYLSSAVVLDLAKCRLNAARLTLGIANKHLVNTTGTSWGGSWQSGYWAYSMGMSAWLNMDSLPYAWDQEKIWDAVEYEANFQLNSNRPEIWKDSTGADQPFSGVYSTGTRTGNSAAEEDMWQATILDFAATAMPSHPNALAWKKKAAQFGIVGAMSQNDLWNTTTNVNGDSPNHWTVGNTMVNGAPAGPSQIGKTGYNWSNEYIVTNHGKRNPDYMQADAMRLAMSLHHSLRNESTPEWVRWNSEEIYGAMRTVDFPGTTYPTKPMYQSVSSASLYFPDGADWGVARHTGYWLWDSLVETHITGVSGTTTKIPVSPTTWDSLHGNAAKAMQDRTGMPFGQVVLNDTEDSYPGREGWHAYSAAFIVLNKVLTNAGRLSWTNADLTIV